MIAHAPGKLVLSGAYVVLDGAEAVVVAVNRYAIAYAERQGSVHSPELREAFPGQVPPFVDTSAMWTKDRKIGLGSSSAALVAALAARTLDAEHRADDPAVLSSILERAYGAHRRAQGGGSGIDVVACTYGGVRMCRIAAAGPPESASAVLPDGLYIEAFRCPESSSTPRLLGGVRGLREADRGAYDALTAGARSGAEDVAAALREGDVVGILRGLRAQVASMRALGDATSSSIVPGYLRALDATVAPGESVVFQAGAGGGDVAFYVGSAPSTRGFQQQAAELHLDALPLRFGVPGVGAGLPNETSATLDERGARKLPLPGGETLTRCGGGGGRARASREPRSRRPWKPTKRRASRRCSCRRPRERRRRRERHPQRSRQRRGRHQQREHRQQREHPLRRYPCRQHRRPHRCRRSGGSSSAGKHPRPRRPTRPEPCQARRRRRSRSSRCCSPWCRRLPCRRASRSTPPQNSRDPRRTPRTHPCTICHSSSTSSGGRRSRRSTSRWPRRRWAGP